LEAAAKETARQLRRSFRVVLDSGLGLSVAPFPIDPSQEATLRFELGAGVQKHFTDQLGFQALLFWGLAGVTRPNVTTPDQKSFINSYQDATLEGSLLVGPFGRFHMGVGFWLAVGGYADSAVATVDTGRPGTTFFPGLATEGDAVVAVGPNFSFGSYLGGEHRMAVSGKIQPGYNSEFGSQLRLSAHFSLFIP
jgi:hypothetical protein